MSKPHEAETTDSLSLSSKRSKWLLSALHFDTLIAADVLATGRVAEMEFQMIRANTIRTIVRIICRIARMTACVARIIVSQSDYC